MTTYMRLPMITNIIEKQDVFFLQTFQKFTDGASPCMCVSVFHLSRTGLASYSEKGRRVSKEREKGTH